MKFIILSLFLLSALFSNAADIELSDFSYNVLSIDELTVEVVASNSTNKELAIPTTINYNGRIFTVKKIADELFYNNSSIECVSIPNSIDIIGKNAFYSCVNLKKLVIEDGESQLHIDYVPYSLMPAFGHCDNLTTLYVGRNITFSTNYVTASPLYNNTSLKNVEFGPNVNIVPHYLFYYCKGLDSVLLPNSVKSIGASAFEGCENIVGIQLPANLINIYQAAFEDCSSLSSIILPPSLTEIGTDAFKNSALSEISIPPSVKIIDGGAFMGSNLTKIIFEDTSEPIRLPNHINQYQRNQFDYTELSDVYLGRDIDYVENEKYIDEGPFPGTIKNITFGNYVTKINPYLLEYSKFANIEITPNINSIGKYAFHNSALRSIVIPNTVSSIDELAFCDCSYLNNVNFLCENIDLGRSIFRNCSLLTEVNLPSQLKTVPVGCFSGCVSLEDIVLPQSLTSIGDFAFENCENIVKAVFTNDIEIIGVDTFKGCSNLKTIEIGNGVKEIGLRSFADCPIQQIVSHCVTPPTIETNVFNNGTYLNATLYVPNNNINDYSNSIGWKNFSFIISIDDYIAGIDEITCNRMQIFSIYDIDGKLIYSGDNIPDYLPNGLYIIKNGSICKKIMVSH